MEPSDDETIAMREFGEAAQLANPNDPAADPLMSVSDNPGRGIRDAGFENVPLDKTTNCRSGGMWMTIRGANGSNSRCPYLVCSGLNFLCLRHS